MHHSLSVWLAAVTLGFVLGHNTLFKGYELSLTAYHLCAVNQTINSSSVLSYHTSYVQRRACGGWLPWRVCEVTLYRLAYRSYLSCTQKEVMQCCTGYEQVGSYCALPLNSSAEFTAKPGSCPEVSPGHDCGSQPRCAWDTDCPGWQKCCPTAGRLSCTDPQPPAEQGWCFNVTVTVKMEFQRVVATETGMLNHTRLLYSVVTGALNCSDMSVRHVFSWCSGPYTTSSSLLVGSSSPLLLTDVSSRLQALLKHVEEVVDVTVQDMNECAHRELSGCAPPLVCINTVGSYMCSPPSNDTVTTTRLPPNITTSHRPDAFSHRTSAPLSPSSGQTAYASSWSSSITWTEPSSFTPSQTPTPPTVTIEPPHTCNAVPQIVSINPFNITSSSFSVSWTVVPEGAVSFRVVILQGSVEMRAWNTEETEVEVTQLQAGVLYRVCVTPHTCGVPGTMVEIHVKTDAQILQAEARLTNVEFSVSLLDSESPEFKNLSQNIEAEILQSLSPDVQALVDSGKVRIVITGFSAGSVVVTFVIVFVPSENQDIMEVSQSLMASLQSSSRYTVDSTSIQDLNECLRGEMDCSTDAQCVNTWGGYKCVCYGGFGDTNPSLPGRSCIALNESSTLPPTATSTQSTNALTLSTDTPSSESPTNHSSTVLPPYSSAKTTAATSQPITTVSAHPASTTSQATVSLLTSTTTKATVWPLTSTTTKATVWPLTSTTTKATVSPLTLNSSGTTKATVLPLTLNTSGTTEAIVSLLTLNTPGTTKATVLPLPLNTSGTTEATVSPLTLTTSGTTKASPTIPPTSAISATTEEAMVTSTPVITTDSATTKVTVTNAKPPPELITASPPIENISYSETITVECKLGHMSVSVHRKFLKDKLIAVDSLYVGLPQCGVNGGNASHVQLVTAWDECDTVILHNSTHNTVQVMLFNNMSSHTWPDGSLSMPRARLQVPILCSYNNHITISTGYSPLAYDMIKDVVQGSGSFHVTVCLLNGTIPLPENYTFSPNEKVVVEVSINSTLSQVKVVLDKCWATPTNDPTGLVEYVFLDNGCPLPNTYTTVLQNGNDSKALLAVQIFSFVDVDMIYLHCQIQICFKTGELSCRPACLEPKTVSRLSNLIGTVKASSGPYHRSYYKGPVSQQRDTLRTVGFSLLGVALGLLLLGGLVGAILYRKRIGTYNFSFRPRQENFTYNVFDT